MRRRAGAPDDLVAGLAGRTEPALVFLTGPRGAGKSRWSERLAASAREAGLAVAGLISPAVIEAGVKTAIDLLDLATGTRRRLADRPAPGVPGTAGLGWRFLPDTLAWGNEVLEQTGPCDLLVLDELGPLELGGEGGLSSAFRTLQARHYSLAVVVVRPELLAEARERWPWVEEELEVDGRGEEERMTTILDIDFGRLYREHFAASGGREKPPEAWDARAAELSREAAGSPYVDEFVRRMDLSGCTTLLDAGCGPGAIALAVAGRLARVWGLDYSRGMLTALGENAAARGLGNVEGILRAWEDDWSDVPACDVVVASRSTLVRDMEDALSKLDAKANRRVYLTSLVGGRFVPAEILEALGREHTPLPDYIYVLNILYRMGRHPRLDYIQTGRRRPVAPDLDALVRQVAASVGELNDAEKERLSAWYQADPQRARLVDTPRRWAFISWETRMP